jgi:outer membrane lipoprotein carrier protein
LRPDKFRWDYEDTEQKIISNGENVYVYDIDLEQLTIRNLSVALDQSPSVALLMDGVNLQNLYEVSAVESGGGVIDWVALRPLAEDAGYEYLELGFSDQLLLVLRMEDLLGQKTIIQFDQVEINTEVSASIFEFKLPANVDVFYD